MKDEILSYREMCEQENVQTLQKGMNYRLNANYTVILMSQRNNAPYKDRIYKDGLTIEYEGHDIPRSSGNNPKILDQQQFTKIGNLTENGKFIKAIEEYKKGIRKAEIVRAYEKLLPGVWSEKGFFNLIDCKYIFDENKRKVFKFILEEADQYYHEKPNRKFKLKPRSRIIPTEIKKEVWKRDGGKCVICGATDELHFDHDLPFSKGGSSITAENVKILCMRHNLEKSNKIQ
ncbi:MAG: HNH endonuclease [Ignavibacteriae bacterium]|nr:HNH endonuclease [Ignavibacteriota bacterium]MCB0752397.1 HNH endonuclease [Ignavibacteriota bacterium]